MYRVIVLTVLIAAFVFIYRSVLFSRDSVLGKAKRIPVQTAVFAVLAFSTVHGFRGEPEGGEPQAPAAVQAPDVEATAAVVRPVLTKPLSAEDAAAACVERARSEAHTSDDPVAESWLSSVEGFMETAPGEVTVRFAVGPKTGPVKGPQCRSEAQMTCTVSGRDVSPTTPIHMTGAHTAC